MPNKRKCKYCGKYGKEHIVLPVGAFCNREHAILFAQSKQQQDKVKKAQKRAERRELAKRKKTLRTRTWYVKQAQSAFNAYIRERDKGQPCISCDTTDPNLQYHAGHYKTTKAHPELRFNVDNCHLQCSQCNNHLSGNIIEYRKRLLKKIGQKRLDWIEGYHEPVKYSIEKLIEIKEYYNKLRKRLTRTEKIV